MKKRLSLCSCACLTLFSITAGAGAQEAPPAEPAEPPPAAAATAEQQARPAPAEQEAPATEQQAPATMEQKEPPKKGLLEWEVNDFKIKLGGYIKLDAIYDFNEIGSEDSFDPRTIDTSDHSGTNTRLHARQTRLNLDVRGPTDLGELRTYVEGDFFGSGNGFRLRHAYGAVGGVLAGQTWSTFMDEDAMPETLDFESPIAFPLVRQAQARYTWQFGGGSYGAVALEEPESDIIAPPVPGSAQESTPDLNGRLRWAHRLGHTQLGLFLGSATFDPDAGSKDVVFLWGLNLSTKLDVCERDKVFVQATYGPGVGRYRGGNTAAPDTSGDLEAIDVLAGMVGYEHHWCDVLRSTASYSYGTADVPRGVPPTSIEVLQYGAVNLIWDFTQRSWFGIEYLYGAREDVDDSLGSANRLQLSVRFTF